MVHDWKPQSGIKANADKIVDEIESLEDAVTPQSIVVKAEGNKTELHKCFEWNDGVASEKYRLDQARFIIRMLIIVPDEEEESAVPQEICRAYESVTDVEEGRVYKPIAAILSNKDWREELYTEIRTSIDELVRKLEVYEHMSGMGRNMCCILSVCFPSASNSETGERSCHCDPKSSAPQHPVPFPVRTGYGNVCFDK